jgi:AcrR family transcriptional regulator
MRADARRNRALIVSTGVAVFTERGPEASMEEIAQAANLGVGTLYRHFPDRQALLEEIAADAMRDLLATERNLSAEHPDAWSTLLGVIDRYVSLPMSLTKALVDVPLTHPDLPGLVEEVDARFTRLVERAQKEGTMRADLTPSEVVRVLNTALCRAGPPDHALTTVVLDGLRADRTRFG